jgi:hypothetical protein
VLCIDEAPKLFVRKCEAEARPPPDSGGVEGVSIDGMGSERCKPPPPPAANSTAQLVLIRRNVVTALQSELL